MRRKIVSGQSLSNKIAEVFYMDIAQWGKSLTSLRDYGFSVGKKFTQDIHPMMSRAL